MDCPERERLDEEYQQAAFAWNVISSAASPDISTIAGQEENLTFEQRKELAEERYQRARRAFQNHIEAHHCLR